MCVWLEPIRAKNEKKKKKKGEKGKLVQKRKDSSTETKNGRQNKTNDKILLIKHYYLSVRKYGNLCR